LFSFLGLCLVGGRQWAEFCPSAAPFCHGFGLSRGQAEDKTPLGVCPQPRSGLRWLPKGWLVSVSVTVRPNMSSRKLATRTIFISPRGGAFLPFWHRSSPGLEILARVVGLSK